MSASRAVRRGALRGQRRRNPREIEMADASRRGVRRAKMVAIVALVLLAAGAGRTVFMRMSNAKSLEASTAEANKQYVKTVIAKTGDAVQTVQLPGTLQGFVQAPLSSRASGYLKRW